ADVAQAADAPPRWKEAVAGPTCLILQQSAERHVLYRWEAGRLERSEFTGDKPGWRQVLLSDDAAAAEFGRSVPGDRLLTLQFFAIRPNGSKDRLLEITAALGGDRQ